MVNLHPGLPGIVPVRSPSLRELLTATPFLSILIETIDYVVALDSMELGIKIMIFKEVEPSLDWQHLVISMKTQRTLHKDAVPILAESRSFFNRVSSESSSPSPKEGELWTAPSCCVLIPSSCSCLPGVEIPPLLLSALMWWEGKGWARRAQARRSGRSGCLPSAFAARTVLEAMPIKRLLCLHTVGSALPSPSSDLPAWGATGIISFPS